MYRAHRVLDGDELATRRLLVDLGATKGRKNQRRVPGDRVGPVQLRGHLHGEPAPSYGGGRHRGVRGGGDEVAADREEHLHPSVAHGANGLDHVIAVAARRLEVELVTQRIKERR